MKTNGKRNETAWLVPLVCLALIPQAAKAYLDPASGSLVIQVALGGFLATMAALKMYWRKLRGLFGRKSEGEEQAAR